MEYLRCKNVGIYKDELEMAVWIQETRRSLIFIVIGHGARAGFRVRGLCCVNL